MALSSAPASPESPFTDAGWRFLGGPALENALTGIVTGGMIRLTSAPSEEEKAIKRVMDALGKLVQHGTHPPMGWYRTPKDPSKPFLVTDWFVAVLYQPDDGSAVLIKYPRHDEESQDELVQRCLVDGSGSTDGSMHIGQLAPDGRLLHPWAALDADRMTRWALSTGADADLRDTLADLAVSVRRGGLRKAYQAWEQDQLRAVVPTPTSDPSPGEVPHRRSGRRL